MAKQIRGRRGKGVRVLFVTGLALVALSCWSGQAAAAAPDGGGTSGALTSELAPIPTVAPVRPVPLAEGGERRGRPVEAPARRVERPTERPASPPVGTAAPGPSTLPFVGGGLLAALVLAAGWHWLLLAPERSSRHRRPAELPG